MKVLKKILIGLLIFIVLLLVLTWFMPRDFDITVTKKMDAPANYVYNIVNNVNNVGKWDPWTQADNTMKVVMGDKTLGEGASYAWTSDNSGTGELTIKSTSPGKKIEALISSPQMGDCDVVYGFKPTKNGSEMSWNFKSTSSFPMNIMNVFMKGMVKKQFNIGLDNINKLAKQRSENSYNGFTVKEEMIGEKNYVINRGEVSLDKIQQFYTQNLGPLFQKIQSAGVEMDGKPSALIYSYNPIKGVADMATGIPISEAVAISGASAQSIPAGKAIVVDYYGDYASSEIAHLAIDDYLKDRGLFHNYPVLEEYVTDPSKEKDPEKWLTRIIYYLSE
ncbi:MAG: SRPBCC family protein [Saprospiraceae bacterium]